MADIGWRPPPPTHFHASGRRFTHNSSGQSKNPLTAITVSTASGKIDLGEPTFHTDGLPTAIVTTNEGASRIASEHGDISHIPVRSTG